MDKQIIEAIGKAVNDSFKSNMDTIKLGLIVLLITSFVGVVLNFISSLLVKRQDIAVNVSIAKKNNELDVLKNIYNAIAKFQGNLLDRSRPIDELSSEITLLRTRVQENEIAISENSISYFNQLLDLFSVAIVDGRTRNISREKELLRNIKKEYRDI
jgi:hypothetical protein